MYLLKVLNQTTMILLMTTEVKIMTNGALSSVYSTVKGL